MCPWSNSDRYIFHEISSNPLSLSFPFRFTNNETSYLNLEQFILYKFCLHHNEITKSKQIMTTNLFFARNLVSKIQPHSSWYDCLDDILKYSLDITLPHCPDFKNCLNDIDKKTIIYASKDKYSGSGLNISLTEMTKIEQFPGHNKLGEFLMEIKERI